MEVCDPAFDNRFTQAFGFPVEKIQTKVRDFLPDTIKAFIRESPFVVMATADPEGRCDASPKGGKPGFIRILDDRHLLVPDIAGNRLFQSYQNMDANAHVGLIFFIPGISEVVRVNGRASIISKEDVDEYDAAETMHHPLGDRDVLQGIILEVEEAYGYCPRALSYSDLWNAGVIEARKASGAHPLRPPANA